MTGISKMKRSYKEREPMVGGFLRRSFEPASWVLYRIIWRYMRIKSVIM